MFELLAALFTHAVPEWVASKVPDTVAAVIALLCVVGILICVAVLVAQGT